MNWDIEIKIVLILLLLYAFLPESSFTDIKILHGRDIVLANTILTTNGRIWLSLCEFSG